MLERRVVARREVGKELERIANLDMAKLQLFDRASSKISGFITKYKLYIRNKLAEATVEEQVQWVLSYVQGGSADIWKKNILEDLEAGEFLVELKREFEGEEEEAVKVAELKKL